MTAQQGLAILQSPRHHKEIMVEQVLYQQIMAVVVVVALVQ
jgi:hypothetical protein